MSSAHPVNSWDMHLFAASESAFGTQADPAAANGLQVISCNLGPVEAPGVRPKKDRSIGRGMQDGYVSGDVPPMDWNVVTSVKTRADADDAPRELALYKAAGLKGTVNSSTSYVLSMSTSPIETGDFVSATLQRNLGSGDGSALAEALRGCVTKKLIWSGGNKEVELVASGAGVGKYTYGGIDSITLANNSVTSVTITAQESYRLQPGFYICESEIIQVTAVSYGSTSATIVRGALSSTAAAHTAQPLRPYLPAATYAGAPIAEPTSTCVLGAISPIRLIEWSVDFTTGLDLLPHETSSAYVQGAKAVRYACDIKAKAVLYGARVDLAGMAAQRTAVSLSLSQGSGAGGVITFGASNVEVMPFTVPDTNNDVAIVDLSFRLRDGGTASDMFTVTLT